MGIIPCSFALPIAMPITRGADTIAYDTINIIKQQNTHNSFSTMNSVKGDGQNRNTFDGK